MSTLPLPRNWNLKKWWATPNGRRRTRRLRLVETLSLGEHRTVAVVRLDDREFLVGATPHSLSLLSEIGDDAPELLPQRRLEVQ